MIHLNWFWIIAAAVAFGICSSEEELKVVVTKIEERVTDPEQQEGISEAIAKAGDLLSDTVKEAKLINEEDCSDGCLQ